VIFSGLETALELTMTSDSASCEWQLLARDGIYVSPAPRTFGDTMYMAPGNRADVVLRCSAAGTLVLGTTSTANQRVEQTNILTITVEASSTTDEDLPIFTPDRLDYLATVNDYASPVASSIQV
jgi:hypothetical protein